MLKWIETTGRSEEDAITAALFQLGLDRDDVSVEVIERAKSGFLGFGSNPAKVRVSYNEVDGKARPISDESLLEPEAPSRFPCSRWNSPLRRRRRRCFLRPSRQRSRRLP